jgi:hypothetical protein
MSRRNLLIVLVLLLAIIGLGVWAATNDKDANQQNQNQTAEQNNSQNNSDSAEPQDSVEYFEVKELGIRFPLNPDLQGLNYRIDSYNSSLGEKNLVARFGSSAVTDLAKKSSDPNGARFCSDPGVIGAVVRSDGAPLDADRALPPDTKDFGNFLVYYSGPQDVCSTDKAVGDLLSKQIQALQSALKNVQTLDGKNPITYQQGQIKGFIGYPGQGSIPTGTTICAQNINSKKVYCSQSMYGDINNPGKTGYIISVPAGSYQVYATTEKDPRSSSGRLYYSKSGQTQTVVVKNGEVLENITPVWK